MVQAWLAPNERTSILESQTLGMQQLQAALMQAIMIALQAQGDAACAQLAAESAAVQEVLALERAEGEERMAILWQAEEQLAWTAAEHVEALGTCYQQEREAAATEARAACMGGKWSNQMRAEQMQVWQPKSEGFRLMLSFPFS